jgi:hypothetical protein
LYWCKFRCYNFPIFFIMCPFWNTAFYKLWIIYFKNVYLPTKLLAVLIHLGTWLSSAVNECKGVKLASYQNKVVYKLGDLYVLKMDGRINLNVTHVGINCVYKFLICFYAVFYKFVICLYDLGFGSSKLKVTQ